MDLDSASFYDFWFWNVYNPTWMIALVAYLFRYTAIRIPSNACFTTTTTLL